MGSSRVADRYEPLEVIGRGGEATVVKAVDTRHGRLVALKVRVVPATGSADDLLTEARALLTLPPHPGLVHARDDLFEGGRHVLVLDWVEGVNLARLLADEGRPGLPVSSVLRWVAQAADALSVLHHHGVVHGDVKPANLILDDNGRVVLVDLGSSSVPLTATPRGGTPGFRAPEVAAGAPADRRSDVFSLAATVLALLTGQAPSGASPVWNGVAADVAARLEAALRTGLAIDPARRPATPGELVDRLRAGWDDRTPTGVGTVLLTDVVGSTALWEHAPQRVPALLADMQLVVDRSVEEYGGRRLGAVVEGDATMSVFSNAADAVRAAVGIQRDLRSRADALRVRAALATGELVEVDGDLLGPTVNRAARVREHARAGEILLAASSTAVVSVAPPDGVSLVPLGAHLLRGVDGVDEIAAIVAEGVAAPPDPARSPYPGLASFGLEDADLFVGREDVVERCLSLLQAHGFVAIVGASGSGKTSLALAGLASRLPKVIVLRPGAQPRQVLDDSGLPGQDDATVVVDQLEELVTLCRDPTERAVFVDTVIGHQGGVIVSVRADLYGELGAFPELAERLASSHVLLGPLDDADVIRAVQQPAGRCGLVVEEGLAELIAAELGDAPGALPLLGHALREAWLRRDGRRITLAGYRASGGVHSAIATTADRALAALDDEHRTVARRVLLGMVELRTDGDDARRWMSRGDIAEIDAERADEVVDTLVASRLLVADGEQITVAHEALLRAWPQLGEWIAEERADLLALQEIRWAAERWDSGGRSEGDLYRGRRLDTALDLAGRVSLPRHAIDFVETGRLLREREQTEARRRNRRLRLLAGVTSLLAVVAVAVGAVAVIQRNDAHEARTAADDAARQADDAAQTAEANADRAAAQQAIAEEASRRAAHRALVSDAVSLRASSRDLAALLAIEAHRVDPGADTESALLGTLTDAVGLERTVRHGIDLNDAVVFGGTAALPDGTIVIADDLGGVRLVDPASGEVEGTYDALGDVNSGVVSVAPSADGRYLAVTWNADTVPVEQPELHSARLAVWNIDAGEPRFETITVPYWSGSVALNGDGSLVVVSGGVDGRTQIRDGATGELLRELDPMPRPDDASSTVKTVTAEFLPDGRLLLASQAGPMVIVDPSNGAELEHIEAPRELANFNVTVATDGTSAIGLGPRGLIRVDLERKSQDWTNEAPHQCNRIVVVERLGTIVCSERSGRVVAYDLATGALLGPRYDAQRGNVFGVVPTGNGESLLEITDEYFLEWRLDGGGPVSRLVLDSADSGVEHMVIGYGRGRDKDLLVEVIGHDGVPVSQTVEPGRDPAITEYPSVHALVPSATPGRVIAVRADGVGWYDTERRMQVGEAFDPGFEVEELAVHGDRLFVRGFTKIKAFELDDFTPIGPEIDTEAPEIVFWDFAAGPTALYTIERVFAEYQVRVRDPRTGEPLADPVADVRNIAVAGDTVIINTVRGELLVVDPLTLRPIGAALPSINGEANTLALDATGRRLMVRGDDQVVRLYDVAGRTQLGTDIQTGQVGFTGSGALRADGLEMAFDTDQGVVVWDLDSAHWIDAACQIAGRNLTRTEWDDHLGELAAHRNTCPAFPHE